MNNEINAYSDYSTGAGLNLHIQYRVPNHITMCYGGGNVGIGTTDPSKKLHVDGTFRCNSIVTSGDSNTSILNIDRVYATVDYIHMYVTGGTNNSRPLVLQNGYGNVGIKTSTPSYTLDVNGTLNATTIYQNGTTLADSYLSLTGGTLTAPLKVKTATGPYIEVIRLGALGNVPYIRYSNEEGGIGEIGVAGGNDAKAYPVFWDIRGNTGWHTIWHSANDGSGSGLDADMLDGSHSTGYFRFAHIGSLTNKDLNYANNMYGSWNYGDDSSQKSTPTYTYGAYISFGDLASSDSSTSRNQTAQISVNCWEDLGRTYIRARQAGTRDVSSIGKWRTVAFLDDNVSSATKLQTSRTIWGQSFDGSGNVSGDLSGVGNVISSGAFIGRNSSKANESYFGNASSGVNGDGALMYAYGGRNLYFYTNGVERIRVDSSGNVGIGRTNPSYKLDVKGQSRFLSAWNSNISNETCSIIVGTNLAGITGYNSGIGFRALTDYNTPYINHNHAWIGLSGYESTTEAELYDLVFATNGSTKTGNYPTERMRILYNGNVGIGVTAPNYKLDVAGNIHATTDCVFDAKISCTNISATKGESLFATSSGYTDPLPGVGAAVKISGTLGQSGGDVFLCTTSGNVGIGSTDAGTKLDVFGVIRSRAYNAIGNNNAAFVFDKTGSNYTGIGANAAADTIYFGACTVGGSWVSYTQTWRFGGNILANGGVTMYSDQRKKTILNHVELSLKDIANAPLIEHYYNSDDKKTTHVGSIAQYWASMNDWFCKLDSEGFYTMEIQNCALASAISIARELDRYESKTDKTIKQLKKRICQLEEEVERLRAS